MKFNVFKALLIAAVLNSFSPTFAAQRRPLVVVGGQVRQLPAGDQIPIDAVAIGPLPSITSFDPLCGTGTHDCSAAIDTAINDGKGLDLGCNLIYDSNSTWPYGGNWRAVNKSGFVIRGCGTATWVAGSYQNGGTLVVTQATAKPFIQINAGINFFTAKDFTLSRAGTTAASGGDAIVFRGATENANLDTLLLFGHHRGLVLSSTSHSNLRNLIVSDSIVYGIDQTNTSGQSSSQWNMQHVLVQKSGDWGYHVVSTAGAGGMIMGQLTDFQSFANTGGGTLLLGQSGALVFDYRCVGCFMGSDGGGGALNIDWADHIQLVGSFVERSGIDATGPAGSTPAANNSNNIVIGANTTNVLLTGNDVNYAALNGIYTSGTHVHLFGNVVKANGQALSPSSRAGVAIAAGAVTINGLQSGNTPGVTSQQYGIVNTAIIDYLCGQSGAGNTGAFFSGTLPVRTCQNITQATTVAGLASIVPEIGMTAVVTDANAACSFNATPTGGGANRCSVRWDGVAWRM